jgi:hypothetical protein
MNTNNTEMIKEKINYYKSLILQQNKSIFYNMPEIIKLSNFLVNRNFILNNLVLEILVNKKVEILNYTGLPNCVLIEGHIFVLHNYTELNLRINSAIWLLENYYNRKNNFIQNFFKTNKNHPVYGNEIKNLINKYNMKEETKEEDDEDVNRFDFHSYKIYTDVEKKINEKIKNNEIKQIRKTIYDDGQNVHNSKINKSVIENVDKLYITFQYEVNKVDIENIENKLSLSLSSIEKMKLSGTFHRIQTDPSTFGKNKITMRTIFSCVWLKINTIIEPNIKQELCNRLTEELLEANSLCATGHVSRLINCLVGFFDDIVILADYKDQIKVYVSNHYNKILSTHPKMDLIIDEMAEIDVNKKENALNFVDNYGIRNKLWKEFKDYLSLQEFNKYYDDAKNAYVGVKNR